MVDSSYFIKVVILKKGIAFFNKEYMNLLINSITTFNPIQNTSYYCILLFSILIS